MAAFNASGAVEESRSDLEAVLNGLLPGLEHGVQGGKAHNKPYLLLKCWHGQLKRPDMLGKKDDATWQDMLKDAPDSLSSHAVPEIVLLQLTSMHG
jgi:hypothetical protein